MPPLKVDKRKVPVWCPWCGWKGVDTLTGKELTMKTCPKCDGDDGVAIHLPFPGSDVPMDDPPEEDQE